jgi:hypothetical protein
MGLSRPSFFPFPPASFTFSGFIFSFARECELTGGGVFIDILDRGAGVSEVNAVYGVDVREKAPAEEGAGVVISVEGVGGCGGGGGGYCGACGATVVAAVVATLSYTLVSSHCPGEPRPGEPMSSGGSAERMLGYEDAVGGGSDDGVGVATAEPGDEGVALG